MATLKSTEKTDELRIVLDSLKTHLATVNTALEYLAKENVKVAIQTICLDVPDQMKPNKALTQHINIFSEVAEVPNYEESN